MFRGIYNQKLDAKGRLGLPAKVREVLAARDQSKLVLTGWTGCLWVYPLDEWIRVEEQVAGLPSQDPTVLRFVRLFVGKATEVEQDAQGRLLIPPPLREFAGLEKEVMVVGILKRLELWDKGRWQDLEPASEEDYGTLNDAIAGYGLKL